MSTTTRTALRAGAALLGAGALVLLGSGIANAHVTVTPSTAEAGAYSVLTFSVPHGCGDSPTTRIAINMPDTIAAATPTVNPGWELEKVTVPLDGAATDSHGNTLSERVDQILYTARTPLPADVRDVFEIQLQIPEDAAGSALTFPVVQSCESGEESWIQTPAADQNAHELDAPAPTFTVTAATVQGAHGTHATEETSDHAAPAEGAGSGNAWGMAGLATGVAGIVVGVVAIVRGNTRRA